MIEQINKHYSMNNPASVYDEESLTALELASRLAQKVVECIDLVNRNEMTVDEAKQYLVDNLPVNVEKAVENYKNSGALETLLVKAISKTKVDRNGNEQITYAMLAQDIKEMFTGGNTPVVGENAVNTSNIVTGAVTQDKIQSNLVEVDFYSPDKNAYHTPLILLTASTCHGVINPEYTFTTGFSSRDKFYSVDMSTVKVDTSNWSGASFEIYYNPTANIFYVVNGLATTLTHLKQCLYLGCVYGSELVSSTVIPVSYDNRFYIGNRKSIMSTLPLSSHTTTFYDTDKYLYKPSSAYFDFNLSTGEVVMNVTKTLPVPVNGKIYNINFATSSVVVESYSGHTCLWYNPANNTLYFTSMNTSYWNGKDNCLYFGTITTGSGNNCILPHTVNGTFYFNAYVNPRPEAKLMMTNTSAPKNTITAKVDFLNRQLIIPANTTLYYILNNQYLRIANTPTTTDIVVPFVSGNYQYLVGGENGLKFISVTELGATKHKIDDIYYLGFVNVINEEIQLNLNAVKSKMLHILGDSVSTFVDMIPSGNQVFYTAGRYGVDTFHHTWWGLTMDKLGFTLGLNNSYSGRKLTESNLISSHVIPWLETGKESNPIRIIFLGYNDYSNNVTKDSYRQAYNSLLEQIKTTDRINGCKSPVYLCTLPIFNRVRTDGTTVQEFNDIIRDVAKIHHVSVIELADSIPPSMCEVAFGDYNAENGTYLHPNNIGMQLMANKVIKTLKDSQEVG